MLNLKLNYRKESLSFGNNGLNGNNIFKIIRHFYIAKNTNSNSGVHWFFSISSPFVLLTQTINLFPNDEDKTCKLTKEHFQEYAYVSLAKSRQIIVIYRS